MYTKEKPQARRESTERPKSTSNPKSNSSGERLVIPRGADFPSNLDGVKVISGNTYEHKEKIKAAGFKWNPADKTWVKKSFSFEELRKGMFLDDEPEPIEKKNRKRKIYIGLNLSGVDNLAIDGGESPKDFHVTLLYGFTDYPNDDEDLTVRLQNCVDKVKGSIPDKIKLDAIKRFEPSESSDGKAVIVAQVEKGQLEEVHTALVKELKNRGIHIERTFPDYKPHMTLAYIDADQDYPLSEINETADAVNISIGVGYAGEGKAPTFEIKKSDEEKRLVFGWANVAIRTNGEQIQDRQNDMVDPSDLEEAVYDYVLNFRDAGEEHIQSLRKKARMVESVVFTDEKMKAMGIPAGTVPYGWWIGFYVDDDETWEKIKNGTYRMFSVEGKGIRQSIPPDEMPENIGKSAPDAKTFSQLAKFNPYHDRLGRFATSGGGASFSANPNTVAGRKAIERASQQSPLIGVAYGTTKYPDKQKQRTGGYTSSITGSSFDMPKLESNEAEQNREKALRHVERYFSSKTPNKEKYDETMKRYLEETDSSEWAKRANKSFFGIGHDFITAKTPKERTEEAARRKDGEARRRAMDRAAMKGTKAHKRFRDFDHEMTLKYGSKKYDKMTQEESQKWDELRNARVFRNIRGQWQIAKSFSDLMKFNPYHDRLGRFTTGGGFGVSSSMYSGDKGRQAVTFSANPDTVAGAKAIARHGGVVPRAYGMGAGGNASTNTETNQNPNRNKPAENPKNDNRTPEERRKAAIKDAEDRIRHQNNESAAVIDSNGNQILFKDGGKSQVSFTNAECKKMKGATLTHNHPSSSMFSYEDMNMFTYRELAEIRATTREGRTFVIRRDPNNSKGYAQENKFPNAYAKQFKKSLRNATDYLDKKGYREKVADGRVSQKQANKELRQHMADSLTKYCSRYAKNYGFEFFVDEGGS